MSHFTSQTRRTRNVSCFTLIELLIVIGLIAAVATLMMPVFGNMEKDAKSAASTYNAAGIRRFLETYYAKNGGYPSSLHNGLSDDADSFVKMIDSDGNEMENTHAMPATLLRNMQNATRVLKSDGDEKGQFRQSLYNAGLKTVMTGFNGYNGDGFDSSDYDKFNSVIRQAPLRCINADWLNLNGAPVVVKGKRLSKWVKNEWEGGIDASWCRLIPLFVTETSLMATGTDLRDNQRVSLGGAPVSPYAKKGEFSYYVVVFYAFSDGKPAYIYTIISPEGETLESSAY